MQDILAGWQAAIGQSHIGYAVANIVWVKALLESAHILAMGLVLFSVGMIAARLAGLAGRSEPLAERISRFTPWVWGALIVVFVTGFLLLTGAGPRRGLNTPMFQLKMVLMLASIALTALLQITVRSDQDFWDLSPSRRIAARVMAPACLLLWMATVCAGRWLAYAYVLFPDA
jgi:hypothetical protein